MCIGCKACEVACKQWNDLPADGSQSGKGVSYDYTGDLSASTWRHVRFVELFEPSPQLKEEAQRALDAGDGGKLPAIPAAGAIDLVDAAQPASGVVDVADAVRKMGDWVFMSDVCKHCTNAGCLDACPTGALIRTEHQTVVLQPDVCNGCGYCVPACPFGVVDRDPEDGRAGKCTLCYDRLEDGLEPACAKSCPTDSIQFGPHEELVEIASRRVAELHRRGIEGAYLYGAGDEPGRAARRRSRRVLPVDRAARALRTARTRGLAGAGERGPGHAGRGRRRSARERGRGARVRHGRTPRRDTWRGTGEHASTAGRERSSTAARRRSWLQSTSPRTPPADARPSGWPTTTPTPATSTRRSARAADRARGPRPSRARRSRSRALTSATLGGRFCTRRATPAMPVPSRLPGRSRRRTGGCAARRSRRSTGRSSTRRCGAGKWRRYFWFGGMASGSAFVALACDAAGDHRSAAIARKVALGAVAPAPVLLIADLGRPERFLNMMRIFKPRSPMNMGAWCLVAFSGSGALAVGCDLIGRPKAARALGALTSLFGSYLGSYTGVLLACTAVPVWSRSRTILGPAFVATATATGAAATRLVLVASGLPHGHPTRRALGTIETASMLTELSHLGARRAAAGRRRRRAPPRAPRTLLPYRQEPRRARSLASVSRAPHWPARARTRQLHVPRGRSGVPLRLGLRRKGLRDGRRGRGRDGPRPTRAARRPPAGMAKARPVGPALPAAAARQPREEPTAKPSGAPASRSSGGYAADGGQSGTPGVTVAGVECPACPPLSCASLLRARTSPRP